MGETAKRPGNTGNTGNTGETKSGEYKWRAVDREGWGDEEEDESVKREARRNGFLSSRSKEIFQIIRLKS